MTKAIAVGGAACALAIVPAYAALSSGLLDGNAPQAAPTAAVGAGQLRLPPNADGIAPPESPDVAAHIAAVDQHYALTPLELSRAQSILSNDARLNSLLGGATYTVEAVSSWKGATETDAYGVNFDLVLDQPLTTGTVTVPALERTGTPELKASSYGASLTNVTRMAVLVRFVDNQVVDVQPDTSGSAVMRFLSAVPDILGRD